MILGARPGLGQESPSSADESGFPVRIYQLESLEIKGSNRITPFHLEEYFALKPGTALNDETVLDTRQKLLGTGLFRSVLLYMKKGSTVGKARLVIELEDEPTVLTDWGVGGSVGLTYGEPKASNTTPGSAPLGYRMELISRNLMADLHRGGMLVDIDANGQVREGQLAYGFPRFANEGVQFDAQFSVVDPYFRYLNTMGFGSRGEALWSQEAGDYRKFKYGIAMYLNQGERFAFPEFPKNVAGPKVVWEQETRFLGFFPSSGHKLGLGAVVSPGNTEDSLLELSAAQTYAVRSALWLTLQGDALIVGRRGVSSRLESRLDWAFDGPQKNKPDSDQAALFLKLRYGNDHLAKTDWDGSAATLGLRYHSAGFIAELAIKVTRTPKDLEPFVSKVEDAGSGGGAP